MPRLIFGMRYMEGETEVNNWVGEMEHLRQDNPSEILAHSLLEFSVSLLQYPRRVRIYDCFCAR